MRLGESRLKGRRVAVMGYNARPLACSAHRAGAYVLVSDFWGDQDLSLCCDASAGVTAERIQESIEV